MGCSSSTSDLKNDSNILQPASQKSVSTDGKTSNLDRKSTVETATSATSVNKNSKNTSEKNVLDSLGLEYRESAKNTQDIKKTSGHKKSKSLIPDNLKEGISATPDTDIDNIFARKSESFANKIRIEKSSYGQIKTRKSHHRLAIPRPPRV